MPEHPHIPSREAIPHVAEPYRQGYAPISTAAQYRREERIRRGAYNLGGWVIFWLVVTGLVLAFVGTEWIQL